jgi:TonB dependent receptor/TonB-dependent Receptor Plug Domain
MKPFFLFLFFLLNFSSAFGQYRVSGYLRDAANGELLIGVKCLDSLSGISTRTNEQGFFILSGKNETFFVQCSYLGYNSATFRLIAKDSVVTLRLLEGQLINEVKITAERAYQRTMPGLTSIPVAKIKSMPSFSGEPDVLKAITFIPGFQNGREGYSNLHVRGGGRDQNLILLDGAPIYNQNHAGGFLSLFNSEVLKKVDVYKSGFPARYGDRLSSVLDIRVKDGNLTKRTGKSSIGVVTSSLSLEGPLAKGKASYLIAARYFNFDLVTLRNRLKVKRNKFGDYIKYGFFDINAKINRNFKNDSRLYINLYFGGDNNNSVSLFATQNERSANKSWIKINNITASLGYSKPWGPRSFWQISLHQSFYKAEFGNSTKSKKVNSLQNYASENSNISHSGLSDTRLRFQVDTWVSNKHHLIYGIEGIAFRYDFGVDTRNKFTTQDTLSVENGFSLQSEPYQTAEVAIFAEDDWHISKKISINYGIRYSSYRALKPSPIRYQSPEPRIALRQLVNERSSVKLAYTYMGQYQHQLIEKVGGFERERWVSASALVPPQRAQQVSLGWYSALESIKTEYSIEAYYKKMSGLVESKTILRFTPDYSRWENAIYQNGKGTTYGTEFSLQKEGKKFSGTAAYTLSWNFRQFAEIDNGQKFPFTYDRRHILMLTGTYEMSKLWQFAANFSLQTGEAFSVPAGYVKANDFFNYYQAYSTKNNGRLPVYHRLDIAFHKNWISPKWKTPMRFSFNVYNAYNRKNAVFMYIKANKLHIISQFGILPSISYGFNF